MNKKGRNLPRDQRRASALRRAIAEAPTLPIKGSDLCRLAGIEGPHAGASLAAAVAAGVLTVAPGDTLRGKRPQAAKFLPPQ